MWKYSANARAAYLEEERGNIVAPSATGHALFEHHELELHISLDENGKVAAAAFAVQGSPVWNASARVLCRMVLGRSPRMLRLISADHLRSELGHLPETDSGLPCLPLMALEDLIERVLPDLEPDVVICACMQVTRRELIEAIQTHRLDRVEEIRLVTSAVSGCSSCRPDVEAILREYLPKEPAPVSTSHDPVLSLIEDMIEGEIRPALRLDKGDIEIVSLEGKTLRVRLKGACRGCASSATTLKHFVEDRLRALVDPGLDIVAVEAE